MRRSRDWLLLLVVLGLLVVVFVPVAVRYAFAPPYTEVDLKSLGWFPFDQNYGTNASIPARWRNLDGKHVALEGFMFDPLSQGSATPSFQLVYQIRNQFGGPPLVQERVFATVPHGAVQFSPDWVRVEGTLHVSVSNPTGNCVWSVFQLDVDRVSPIPGSSLPSKIAGVVVMSALIWLPALIVLCIRTWNRRKRLRPGLRLCPICGYDLRASANRCPECGSLVNDRPGLSPTIGRSLEAM